MADSVESLFYLEWTAVILSLIYVLLAVKEFRSCWILAIISSFAYIPVFYLSKLYMESVLQVFFIILGFIGWFRWYDTQIKAPIPIISFNFTDHFRTLAVYCCFALVLGGLLAGYTDASYPYLDSLVTSFSIAASFMQTKKVIENWIYWILIDSLAIYIYIQKGLRLTAGLYLLFLVLAVLGYNQWRKTMARKFSIQSGGNAEV